MHSVGVDLLSLQHIRTLKIFLSSFGAWPGEVIGEKINLFIRILGKAIPLQASVFLIGQTYYIIAELPKLDFIEIGDLFLAFFLALITTIRTALPNLNGYRKISSHFFLEFHLLNFKHVGGHFEKMYHKVIMFSEYFIKFMTVLMLGGLTLYNISPIYNNFSNGAYFRHKSENVTYKFAVYYKYPGFQQDDHFKISTFLNFYLSWLCGVSVCTLDMYLCLMVIQIIAHIKVLKYNIRDISGKKKNFEKYTEEENDAIHMRIKGCVDHHRIIMKFVDAMSKFFGPLLGLNYAFHLCGCCLMLLELSSLTGTAIIRFGPLTLITFGQLIMISVTFEVVCSESDKLSNTVYATPWELMDIRNQTSICIILRRIQEPLKVTAAGMTDVSVRTMASILKTTFSYFAFLKSMN